MTPVYTRSLRRRRPGQGNCGCCFMFGLGLFALPLVAGLGALRALRGRD